MDKTDHRGPQWERYQVDWMVEELRAHRKLLITISICQALLFAIIAIDIAAKWVVKWWPLMA
jgi:hypothetical protein